MNLSEHFSLYEFEYSDTAIKNNITNKANDDVIKNLSILCENLLEPIRLKLGKPIQILSGYRCESLNKLVGGVNNSQHKSGHAADITVENMSHPDLFNFIKNNFKFDQLILEHVKKDNEFSGWVHVSYNHAGNRKQCLKIG
ncbi:D-Ala-D-Ala carboxypeptidase family metallohydrolase [Fluviispira vulneris]|uniref:D-Ala-D-Ala carboxypeptidase family metallohydrolase n=1 Tax=Fluviispira vulneris TaxID=2763012 RepID=UPI00164645F9|nr:D-Ala-D-Ala carboxypeptidase family metallohydrolase [Fluviispira vulneris]